MGEQKNLCRVLALSSTGTWRKQVIVAESWDQLFRIYDFDSIDCRFWVEKETSKKNLNHCPLAGFPTFYLSRGPSGVWGSWSSFLSSASWGTFCSSSLTYVVKIFGSGLGGKSTVFTPKLTFLPSAQRNGVSALRSLARFARAEKKNPGVVWIFPLLRVIWKDVLGRPLDRPQM